MKRRTEVMLTHGMLLLSAEQEHCAVSSSIILLYNFGGTLLLLGVKHMALWSMSQCVKVSC